MASPAPNPLTVAFVAAHPRDAARVLDRLEAETEGAFAAALPPGTAAAVLRHMTPRAAAACLSHMGEDAAAAAIESLETAAAAALLRRLDETRREGLLVRLTPRVQRSLRTVIGYAEGLVGAAMDPLAFTLAADTLAGEAIGQARADRPRIGQLVWVLGDENRLAGGVDVRDLLIAAPEARLGALARAAPATLSARARLDAVLDLAAWRTTAVLPVLDRDQRFLGALDHAAARDAAGRAVDEPGGDASSTVLALADLFWGASCRLFAVAAPAPRDAADDG